MPLGIALLKCSLWDRASLGSRWVAAWKVQDVRRVVAIFSKAGLAGPAPGAHELDVLF